MKPLIALLMLLVACNEPRTIASCDDAWNTLTYSAHADPGTYASASSLADEIDLAYRYRAECSAE